LNLGGAVVCGVDQPQARRSAHRSVAELEADITAWIAAWNEGPKPFVWAKTADEILENLARYLQPINNSGH
jgi:hypothetical protein